MPRALKFPLICCGGLIGLVMALAVMLTPARAQEEPVPDFDLNKTWEGTPRVGEPLTFHVTATNNGGQAIDLHLWDELPSTMHYVSHSGSGARVCDYDPFPPGTIAGNAICRYDTASTGQTLTMDVTVIPTEAGTFTNTIFLQYVAPQLGNAGFRINETFPVTVLPAPTKQKQCKQGGYADFGFENQGECIAFVKDSS
jgi:uncharacterized repeat protein (TIGR01451 family)